MKLRRATSRCLCLSTYQALMLITKKPPRMKAPRSTWPRRCIADGLNTIAQKSVITARAPASSTTISKPAGVCCHELATTIHTDENTEPRKTIIVAKKWVLGPTRSQPKTSTARKPDSKKKAKIPSAASAEPKTSPTNREYVAQFVPNWNSMTMPLATPTAKLTAKIRVQNRAMRS